MLILDTGRPTNQYRYQHPVEPDCWRIVDYADSPRPYGTRYTLEALNIAEMRIVGYPVCSNDLDVIRHAAIQHGLRGVRGFI